MERVSMPLLDETTRATAEQLAVIVRGAYQDGGFAIEGYEMLKGLSGVSTHAHREWIPVIDNTQDWVGEAPRVESLLRGQPQAHGLLIRRHGLYTWGRALAELKRHLEIL